MIHVPMLKFYAATPGEHAYICHRMGRLVATLPDPVMEGEYGRLFTAAPDLLEALRAMKEKYDKLREDYAHASALVHWANATGAIRDLPDTGAMFEDGAKRHPRTGRGAYMDPPRIAVEPTFEDDVSRVARTAIEKATGADA